MKGKFSLNNLLHNKKLMLVFSIVAAVAIWATVVYGSGNTETRIINMEVSLSLKDSAAGNSGFQIFEGATQRVDVEVRGSRAYIYKLKTEDIRVTADYSEVQEAGYFDVRLIPMRNSSKTDYEIISVSPQRVRIYCDSVRNKSLYVEADAEGVAIDDTTGYQLGTPIIEAPGLTDNLLQIEGPSAVVDQIDSVVAKVKKPKTIAKITTFEAELVARDADGQTVDTSNCTFTNLAGSLNVTVPVITKRTVVFEYGLANLPDAWRDSDGFVTLSPASIELVGAPDIVESYAQSIENLGTFNFDHIALSDSTITVPLNVPQGIQVLDGTEEAVLSIDMQGFTSRTFSPTLTKENTEVENAPRGRTVTLSDQVVRNVRVVGPSESVAQLTEGDLSFVVDLEDTDQRGAVPRKVRVLLPGYDDVWVYYGSAETDGYEVFVTIQ